MTNEQAIEVLKQRECCRECVVVGGDCHACDKAFEMAIKALEQQPSEDCVSRQAVLSKAELIELEDGQSFMSIDPEDVKALSPVTLTHCIATVKFSKDDLREICNERIEIECTHGTCKDCKHWKDSDGVFRRGIGAESKCHINTIEVYEGTFYCADFEKRGNEE